MTTNTSAVDTLLTQSKSLADSLSFAFNTSTGIPSNNLYFTNHTNDGSTTNGLADIGTLCLEWQHLSDLTGDPTYGDLAQKAEMYLLNPLPESNEPFPGLVGTNVNISNGVFLDATGGWNGGDDSFYEYLIKMYVYDSSRYSNYSARWIMAADSTIKYLTSNRKQYSELLVPLSHLVLSLEKCSRSWDTLACSSNMFSDSGTHLRIKILISKWCSGFSSRPNVLGQLCQHHFR